MDGGESRGFSGGRLPPRSTGPATRRLSSSRRFPVLPRLRSTPTCLGPMNVLLPAAAAAGRLHLGTAAAAAAYLVGSSTTLLHSSITRRASWSLVWYHERPSPGGGGGGSGLPRPLPNDPPLVHRASSLMEPHATTWDAGRSTTSATDVYEVAGGDFSPNYWTPGYSQPRASSSQYFSNMMTQELGDGLELLNQQDATPSTGGKGASKRGSNYSTLEDIQLCKSWIHISNDPIIGNDQPGKTYWERIANDFHSNRDFESDRTPNSLEHRFGIILKECMKFHGYYEEVERRHPSGIPYQEHLLQAHERYARKAKGKKCQFEQCWLTLRHTQKFESTLEVNKRPAKSKELNLPIGSQQDDESAAQGQESSSIPAAKTVRPPGRKQSKEKLKK